MVNKFGIMNIEEIEEVLGNNCLNGIGNSDDINYDTDPHRPINIIQKNSTTILQDITGISLHKEEMKICFYTNEIPKRDDDELVNKISIIGFKNIIFG